MRDLRCAHCSNVLVKDFWIMVETETVRTFSSFSLTCRCGQQTRVELEPDRAWRKFEEVEPVLLRA
jgi:RNase P subunit RPR2